MRKATVNEKKRCPNCGKIEQQVKAGFNRSGTQRCICRACGTRYTLEPKKVAYPEEIRQLVGFEVSMEKSAKYIQSIEDNAPAFHANQFSKH